MLQAIPENKRAQDCEETLAKGKVETLAKGKVN